MSSASRLHCMLSASFARIGDAEWSVPPGARLTEARATRCSTGHRCVTVIGHAAKGGEIRAQLVP